MSQINAAAAKALARSARKGIQFILRLFKKSDIYIILF